MSDLRVRAEGLCELMDDPDCDDQALRRTYAQFRYVNRVVAGWRGLYRRLIQPLLAPGRPATLLDIGSGGGDIARSLHRWAAQDGIPLQVTGVDPDRRAYAFATARPVPPGVHFEAATSAELVADGRRFDVVISNHLLHHLTAPELTDLLCDSTALATGLVLHSDLARRRYAYTAYRWLSLPLARGSFVRTDGLRSLRRSYTAAELSALARPPWQVVEQFPARLVLRRELWP